MSFKFILDSATLFNTLIGQIVCADPNLTIYFNNITIKVNKWLNKGRNISSLGGDPFEWRPRALNYGADTQCEIVLDNCLSFVEKHRNFHEIVKHGANLYIQSDGGCRHMGHSATGWRIRAVNPINNNSMTIASGGTLHTCNYSSLHIETLALNEAVNYLDDAI